MNYYFTGILIILLVLFALVAPAYPAETQTNVSGSNTSIEGGYTGGATTYESGSESTSTTTNSSSSNIKSAPPTAGAPSYNSMTQDVGISGGKHFIDKNCERLKLARILNDFGMRVAAVALLCQDERVFESMIQAGTPCPISGKIGKDALALWNKYDHERPNYKTYVKRMEDRKKADELEQIAMTKEFERIEAEKIKEEAKKLKKMEWVNPR